MTVGLKFSLLISIRGCEQHIKMPYMYMFSKKEYLSLMDKSTNIRLKKIFRNSSQQTCVGWGLLLTLSASAHSPQPFSLYHLLSEFINFKALNTAYVPTATKFISLVWSLCTSS